MRDLELRVITNGGPISVDDEWAIGCVNWTNLGPIQEFLKHDVILHPSQRLFQLLTGQYDPVASYAGAYIFTPWVNNGRYIDQLDLGSIGFGHDRKMEVQRPCINSSQGAPFSA
ncbi:MAG TPA: hypothetical protein VME69_09385 [Methylocella sp.]|nr:hypothetical protein [Methylocella sp.]